MGFRSQNNYDDDMERAYKANTPAHIRWLSGAAITFFFGILVLAFAWVLAHR